MSVRPAILALAFGSALMASAHAQRASDTARLPQLFADSLLAAVTPSELRDSIEASRRRLQQTRATLEELARRQNELERQEQSGLARLEACEERIELTERYLHQLAAQTLARGTEIRQVTTTILRRNTEIRDRRTLMARRLVGIYKYSRIFPLQAALGARSLPDLYRRIFGLRWAARADRHSLTEMRALADSLEADHARLIEARRELLDLAAQSQQQEAALLQARAEESAMLARIRSERSSSLAIQDDLRRSAASLESLVVHLEGLRLTSPGDSGFEFLKGRLPWPVAGRVIVGFGAKKHPRYQIRTANLGIDISPDGPAAAVGVADGLVAYADRFLGYGNLVILEHGGGYYTLYGNLADVQVQVGSHARAGTAVGMVDDYLHFEVRQQGQPVNPQQWLAPR